MTETNDPRTTGAEDPTRVIEDAPAEATRRVGADEGPTRLVGTNPMPRPAAPYVPDDRPPFQDDELLVLASANSHYSSANTSLSLQEFCRAPLVLREHGSGTLEAIEKALHQQHITLGELNIRIYLGSTEAIKLFVKETDSLCILSKYAVITELQNGTLRALQVENLCFKRQLCFVQAPGPQSPLVSRFIDFVCKRAQLPANGC